MRLWMTGLLLATTALPGGAAVVAQSGAAQNGAAQKGAAKSLANQDSPARNRTSSGAPTGTRKVTTTTATTPGPAQTATLTPAREAAAMTFAKLHHPELAQLLTRLKKRKTEQYNQAVTELFQTSERLARTRDRAPDRYLLALEAWKLDSRIRLLAARMTMQGSARLEEQLMKLLGERVDVRLQQLVSDRERLALRVEKIDQTIEDIRRDPEAAALKDLQRVKRTLDSKTHREKKTTPVSDRPVVAPTPKRRPSPHPSAKTKAQQ